ncbi:MAG: methyltransferase [Propionibacteriales bacterium]|nr:methyltransferase [Propionibacteriales bacterium]
MPTDLTTIPAPVRMMQLTTGSQVSQSVSVAAALGVADVLAGGPRAVDDIADAVGADPGSLYRLLRVLGDVGVFEESDGRTFALTEVGELLCSDRPGTLRGWAVLVGSPFHRDAWTDLLASVRTGEPAFDRVHGQLAFDFFRNHPDDQAVLDGAMTSISGLLIAAVVSCYDFSPFGTVVDVGGGHGALLAAVLTASPGARGVLFEQPHVAAAAGGPLDAAGVRDRCEIRGGDFFEAVPTGGDAYLLSNIVHDWGDDDAVQILTRCREALGDHGRVLVTEDVLPSGLEPSQAKLIDLEMLVMGPGRQRTEEEYGRLFARAGLRLTRLVPCQGSLGVVEAVRA